MASFWATWKSMVHGRKRGGERGERPDRASAGSQRETFRHDAILGGVVAERVEQGVGHVGLEAEGAGAVGQFEQLHHALPAMHAAPADFSLGGEAFAMIGGDVAGQAKRLGDAFLVALGILEPNRRGCTPESMRTMP